MESLEKIKIYQTSQDFDIVKAIFDAVLRERWYCEIYFQIYFVIYFEIIQMVCRLIDSAIKGTKWFCISVICTSILSTYILIRQIYPASGFWFIVTDVVTGKNRILTWHRDSQANEAVRQTISFVSVVTVTPGFITISRGMRNHFNSMLWCCQCRYRSRRKITLTKHWKVRNTLFLVLPLIAWNGDFHSFSFHCTDELIDISLKLSQCKILQKLQNNFFAINYQEPSIRLAITFSSNYSKTSSIGWSSSFYMLC